MSDKQSLTRIIVKSYC